MRISEKKSLGNEFSTASKKKNMGGGDYCAREHVADGSSNKQRMRKKRNHGGEKEFHQRTRGNREKSDRFDVVNFHATARKLRIQTTRTY